jgi:RsiW-degrading membrane proteinase PrsW (M82 family)
MSSIERMSQPASGGRAILVVGAVTGAVAALLYASSLSRAVGVVLGVIAVAAVVLGVITERRRQWPPRPVRYVIAAALVVVAIVGIVTLVYSLTTRSSPA